MKNQLFIKNVIALAKLAKQENMTYVYRILNLCNAVFSYNINNKYTKPDEAYTTVKNGYASLVNSPFNAMALDFFLLNGFISLFEKDQFLSKEEALEILAELQEDLVLKSADDECIGIGSNICKRNPRDIITEAYYHLNQVKGCLQIESFAYNALILFMDYKNFDADENTKHYQMFLDSNSEEILDYLKNENSFSEEVSYIIYNGLVESRIFDIMTAISKDTTLNIATKVIKSS